MEDRPFRVARLVTLKISLTFLSYKFEAYSWDLWSVILLSSWMRVVAYHHHPVISIPSG